jgi:CheY-like chemotaxis protein
MPNSKLVLIVEDEPLIAMAMESLIEDAGMTPVSVYTIEDAMALLATSDVRVAILDYAIHGESSEGVAKTLRERRIPFVLCSGSDLPDALEAFSGAPCLSKPFRDEELQDVVMSLSH